jgi:hypothetical protein
MLMQARMSGYQNRSPVSPRHHDRSAARHDSRQIRRFRLLKESAIDKMLVGKSTVLYWCSMIFGGRVDIRHWWTYLLPISFSLATTPPRFSQILTDRNDRTSNPKGR